MKREVKFRGKSVKTGEWLYGYLQKYQETHASRLCVCAASVRTWSDALLYEVIPDTVGQFTGLYDKNGKEIYEGDIVMQYWGFPHYRGGVYYDCNARIGSVVFHESGSFLLLSGGNLYRLLGDGLTQEVQGNIHDNPNLLSNGRD